MRGFYVTLANGIAIRTGEGLSAPAYRTLNFDIQFITNDQIIASSGYDLFGLDRLTGAIEWLYLSELFLSDRCAVMKGNKLYEIFDQQYLVSIDTKRKTVR